MTNGDERLLRNVCIRSTQKTEILDDVCDADWRLVMVTYVVERSKMDNVTSDNVTLDD